MADDDYGLAAAHNGYINALLRRYSRPPPSAGDIVNSLWGKVKANAAPAVDMWRNAENEVANRNQQFNERASGDLNRYFGVNAGPDTLSLLTALMGGVKTPDVRPRIWYRGTPHMDRLLNRADVTPEGVQGTYFTSDPSYAAAYGPVRSYIVKGSIKDIHLPNVEDAKKAGRDWSEMWDEIHDREVSRAFGEGHAGVRLMEKGWDMNKPNDYAEREMILFDPASANPYSSLMQKLKATSGKP